MRLLRLTLMVGSLLLRSFVPAAESDICPAGTVAMTVASTVDLQNMTNAINCTGEGSFDVTWTGSLQLGRRIEVSNNKNLSITGSSPLVAGLPSDGIVAGNVTGIFGVSGTSTLRLQHLVLEGGSAENGGGVYLSNFSAVYVDGCSFLNNNASTGGAIHANFSEIHIDGETGFEQNSALSNGGAIYAYESEMHVNGNAWLSNNSAGQNGGVIYAAYSEIVVNGNTSFANNSADDNAGVFWINNCSALFNGSTTFAHNSAQNNGGVSYAIGRSVIHVDGHTSFTNNVCGVLAGVIYGNTFDIHVDGRTSFTHNVAGSSGGTIYGGTLGIYITGETYFAYNSAGFYGGVIHTFRNSLINVTGDTTFEHNSAKLAGGVMVSVASTWHIGGNTYFTGNTADANGGALTITAGSTMFINGITSFFENTASWRGGAIVVSSSEIRMNGTTSFFENSAYEGGAMVLDESPMLIDGKTIFSRSSAETNGGAINMLGSNATFMGLVTFSSNTALNGGAIFSGLCPNIELFGVVHFVENAAVLDGGAISLTDPTELNIIGTSFVANQAEFGGAISLASSTRTTAWFERCRFDDNGASDGGALHLSTGGTDEAEQSTSIQHSVFSHNVALESGGALFNVGPLAIDDTEFLENTAADRGLAIMNGEPPLDLWNVTFDGNMLSCPTNEYLDAVQGSSGSCRLQLVCEKCDDVCEIDRSIATITSDTVPSCREIPVGVSKSSINRTTLETFELLQGYYRVSAGSRDILECYRKESCIGGDNALNYCATGYAGPCFVVTLPDAGLDPNHCDIVTAHASYNSALAGSPRFRPNLPMNTDCAVCADGYAPGMLNSCHKCSTEHRGLAMGLATGVLIVLIAVLVATWLVPRLLLKSAGGDRRRCWDYISSSYTFAMRALPLSAIKIVVVVLQIITQFTEIAGAVYPDAYEAFLSKMTAINLDIVFFLSNLCIVKTDFYDRLLFSTVGPLAVLTALCGSYIVRKRNRNTEMTEPVLQRNHLAIALFILFFVYSSVSFTIFQTFVCEDLGDGNAYLRADYGVKCWTEKHNAYKTYAIVMVCVYPIGIPALFGWWLARHVQDLKNRNRQSMVHLLPFRGLWSAYKPSCYYYEVVECSRRVVLTGAAVFVLPNSVDQIAVVLLVAVIFMFISESLSPFQNKNDMKLYRLGNAIVLLSVYLALLLKVDLAVEESQYSMVATSLLIAANVGMIVTIIVKAVLMAKRLCISGRVLDDIYSAPSSFG